MSKTKLIKVGSRSSPLAKVQVEEILALLNSHGISLQFDRKYYSTKGDKDRTTSLTSNPADDFFTDVVDAALINHEIDIAIHSAKDLPKKLRKGLEIFALTKSVDETDAFVGISKLADLPPGSRIGTSSLLRQSAVKEINPKIEIVDIRGTIAERLKLLEERKCDGLIIATAALKRLGLKHLIKDIMPWEATPLQGQLAVVGRENDFEFRDLFSTLDVRRGYGKVYLVGAGPGDPDLITLKGIKSLEMADIVYYDYLVDGRLLDFAPRAEHVFVGKRKGCHSLPQAELSRLLKVKAFEGKTIVRLKGGDPLIFGRGADEINYLRDHHVDVAVVPGVSSATAIPSKLGIPLTARGISSSVVFLSAHGEEESSSPKFENISVPKADTVVFLMGLTKLPIIIRSLIEKGWPASTPVIVISKGTRPDEKRIEGTLVDIEAKVFEGHVEPPALIIVGKVVSLRREDDKKLRFLYTGTSPEKYVHLGELINFPMIDILPNSLPSDQVKEIIEKLFSYDYVILTSHFGVKHFVEFLRVNNVSLEKLSELNFLVIGHGTAKTLKEAGLNPAFVSPIETSVGMWGVIHQRFELKGKRILFPRSALPNPFLKEKLLGAGCIVDEVAIYQNIKPKKRDLPNEPCDAIIFTSPSTVKNFLEDYGTIPKAWKILSKGLTTYNYLKKLNYSSEVLSDG